MKRLLLVLLTTIVPFSANRLVAQWVQTNGPEGGEIKCIACCDTMLFVGTEYGVYRSDDDGFSWKPAGPENIIYSLTVKSDKSGLRLFAGTWNGGVYLSTDLGAHWQQVNFGLLSRYIYGLAANDSNLFAGTAEGVFRSPSNGDYWIPSSAGLASTSIRSLTVHGKELYVGTAKGLFVSRDNGANWVSAGLPGEAISAFAVLDGNLVAGTDTSGVFISKDNGSTWELISIPDMGRNVFALAVINNMLFAATERGVYRTHTSGAYWIPAGTGLANQLIYTLHVRGTELFAGTICGVFHSADYGDTWTDINSGLVTTKVHALISSGTDLYAGIWGGIYQSRDNGNSWTPLSRGSACFSLVMGGAKLYAGGGNHVACYDPVQGSWEWVPVGKGWIRALAFNGATLFAGTEGSGAFRITHNAPGWWTITKTSLPDTVVHALAVRDMMVFAGTQGGVFRSSDNGQSWTAVNDGLANLGVAALAVRGSSIFAGTQGGGVFLSTNDGTSWTAVNNGLSGLALDILTLVFSDNNLFAGTWRGGVFVLRDNADKWVAVNAGLLYSDTQPSSVVHGLAIAGNHLFAGTRGAGVWRRPLSEIVTAIGRVSREPSMTLSLEQNVPNPFNPATVIQFTLSEPIYATLKIFNLRGEQVAVILEKQLAAGTHRVRWNASGLASGMYLYRLEAGDFAQSKKLVLLW